jgi:hypothetical protein
MVLGLWAWTRARETPRAYLWAGAALAVATACRPIQFAGEGIHDAFGLRFKQHQHGVTAKTEPGIRL